MEAKQEYKQTEVGLIPNDWEVKELGEIGFFKNGINKSNEDFGFGFPFANLMDVFGKSSIESNEKFGLINSNSVERNLYDLKSGDVLFIRSSVKPSGVGLTSVIENDLLDTVFSGFIIRFRDSGYLTTGFKKYCFYSEKFRTKIIGSSTVSANTNINQESLKILQIPIPPIPEQKAIASALKETDDLIQSLEELIAKKKLIKQGAIKEFLSPKAGWTSVELREVIIQFIVPMRDKPKKFSGEIPWCRIEDFEKKYLQESKSNQNVDTETIKNMNLKVYPIDTLLVSCSAYLGRCAIVKKPLVTNQTFIGLVPNFSKISVEYLFYYMTYKADELNNLSSGTTISYLSREQFEMFQIDLPFDINEQKLIANALTEIDIEIDIIEEKLSKYITIKQGMMQQLLSGKIRLV